MLILYLRPGGAVCKKKIDHSVIIPENPDFEVRWSGGGVVFVGKIIVLRGLYYNKGVFSEPYSRLFEEVTIV